jgi:hypothetical protein
MAAGSASLLLLMVVLCAAASGTALAAITDGNAHAFWFGLMRSFPRV